MADGHSQATPSRLKWGYEKGARQLVKEFLVARLPGDASQREMVSEITERRLTQASVDDAILRLSVKREIALVDDRPKLKGDWRWRAIVACREEHRAGR
jgi:hypothetical protein